MERDVEQREEKVTEQRRAALGLREWDALNRSIVLRREYYRARARMQDPNARVARAARHRALFLVEQLVDANVALVAMDEARRAERGGAK